MINDHGTDDEESDTMDKKQYEKFAWKVKQIQPVWVHIAYLQEGDL